MTDRDLEVIKLLKNCKLLTREQIQKALFRNVHPNVCLRRLKVLADNKEIKRAYYNLGGKKNVYVYYLDKKPAKRNLMHDLAVSEFLINIIMIANVQHIEVNYKIGNVIADAYVRYKGLTGGNKRLFLEVQRSNKVDDCVLKYRNMKSVILDNKPAWNTMPRLVVLTDIEHANTQLKDMKVCYDSLEPKNIREIIF